MLFLLGPPACVGHHYLTQRLHSPSPLKSHILPCTSMRSLGTSHSFFFARKKVGGQAWGVSAVWVSGFTWWAPSQPFSRSPTHLKGRESGDVRLILDTKGERGAEQKKCRKRLSTRQDWETAEWTPEHRRLRHWKDSGPVEKRSKTHIHPFIILWDKFTLTLTSTLALRRIYCLPFPKTFWG